MVQTRGETPHPSNHEGNNPPGESVRTQETKNARHIEELMQHVERLQQENEEMRRERFLSEEEEFAYDSHSGDEDYSQTQQLISLPNIPQIRLSVSEVMHDTLKHVTPSQRTSCELQSRITSNP